MVVGGGVLFGFLYLGFVGGFSIVPHDDGHYADDWRERYHGHGDESLMLLNPRAIAVQGLGFGRRLASVQGFQHVGQALILSWNFVLRSRLRRSR